jgi:uncharacterized protein (TIGR02246 family)
MHRIVLGVALGLLAVAQARAQDKDPTKKEDPAHQELRALRTQVVAACNKGDIDGVLAVLDKDVVVTWLNGEVSRGPQQVREYMERMIKGPNRIVERFEVNPEPHELTHLYGDTGVAFGTSKDHFVLTDGKDFDVLSKWSATLAKKDGKWVIANFHSSTNMFDNPVLNIAIKRTATWVGVGAGVGGLLVGFLLGRLLRHRPAAA